MNEKKDKNEAHMPNYVKLEGLETFDTDLRGGDEGRRAQRGEEQPGATEHDSVAACLSKAIYWPASAAPPPPSPPPPAG